MESPNHSTTPNGSSKVTGASGRTYDYPKEGSGGRAPHPPPRHNERGRSVTRETRGHFIGGRNDRIRVDGTPTLDLPPLLMKSF